MGNLARGMVEDGAVGAGGGEGGEEGLSGGGSGGERGESVGRRRGWVGVFGLQWDWLG